MNGLWVVLFALIMNLAKSSRLHANKLKLEFVQSPLVSYNIFCFAYSSAASYSCTRYTHVHCSLAHAILFFRFRNSITNKNSTIITKTKKKISNSVAANEQNKIDSKNTVNKSWQKKIYTDTYTLSLSTQNLRLEIMRSTQKRAQMNDNVIVCLFVVWHMIYSMSCVRSTISVCVNMRQSIKCMSNIVFGQEFLAIDDVWWH